MNTKEKGLFKHNSIPFQLFQSRTPFNPVQLPPFPYSPLHAPLLPLEASSPLFFAALFLIAAAAAAHAALAACLAAQAGLACAGLP
eukprot:1161589-Pelagomonas_calceolata.AAC.6